MAAIGNNLVVTSQVQLSCSDLEVQFPSHQTDMFSQLVRQKTTQLEQVLVEHSFMTGMA